MAIEIKCENCIYFGMKSHDELSCCLPVDKDWNIELCGYGDFVPKEELVRQDERDKFITLLKSDLENFDGLADDCVVRKDLHELLESNAVRKYIESTIKLLEKE